MAKAQVLEDDELALHTRTGKQISNKTGRDDQPAMTVEMTRIWRERLDLPAPRSVTAAYNCVGMVFGCRRTHIDPDQIRMVLAEDKFKKITVNQAQVGDVVIYIVDTHDVHIGIIQSRGLVADNNPTGIVVLSKWGQYGEFSHRLEQVPEDFGRDVEYWTDRK